MSYRLENTTLFLLLFEKYKTLHFSLSLVSVADFNIYISAHNVLSFECKIYKKQSLCSALSTGNVHWSLSLILRNVVVVKIALSWLGNKAAFTHPLQRGHNASPSTSKDGWITVAILSASLLHFHSYFYVVNYCAIKVQSPKTLLNARCELALCRFA